MAELAMEKMQPYPAYQPTGVEWMPEIPTGWAVKRLRNICRLQGRVGFKGYQVADLVGLGEGALTIGGKHIRHNVVDVSDPDYISWEKYYESPEIMIETGDIIVAQRGTLGKVAHLTDDIGPATINPSLIILKDVSIFSKFLYWYLRSNYVLKVIDMLNTSTAVPMLSQAQFSEFKVLIPPDNEQRTIVRFIEDKTAQLDQLITQKRQMLELLREERAALLNHAVTKGLDAAAPRRESGVAWLGEVPAHWESMKMKHACSLLRDGTHQPPARVENGYPLLSVRNIVNGRFINLDDDSQISEVDFAALERSFEVRKDDIVLAVVGATLGKVAIVEDMPPFTIQRSLAVFRPKPSLIEPRYMHCLFQSDSFQELLWSNVGFSAQPGIYLGALGNFNIVFPGISEQKLIVEHVESHSSKIAETTATINQEITLLQEYRAALIAEAVTGQIDVRDYVPAAAEVLM